jgi:hypothetical protein
MKNGRQWIHFDAQFPLEFGYQLLERFGPAGQLLFVQFLCACKRSFPQGEIHYRTEEEARITLGALYEFKDADGHPWTFEEFWKWCSYRGMMRLSRRGGRRGVAASHWDDWEMSAGWAADAARKRRSRAKKRPTNVGHVQTDASDASAPEVGGGRLEVGGGRLECEGGNGKGIALLEKLKEIHTVKSNNMAEDGPPNSSCRQCGFFRCECPPEPAEAFQHLRKAGWRREGEGGKWIPPQSS